jgi:hypothetical protein
VSTREWPRLPIRGQRQKQPHHPALTKRPIFSPTSSTFDPEETTAVLIWLLQSGRSAGRARTQALKVSWRDDTTQLGMSPLEFMHWLAALACGHCFNSSASIGRCPDSQSAAVGVAAGT